MDEDEAIRIKDLCFACLHLALFLWTLYLLVRSRAGTWNFRRLFCSLICLISLVRCGWWTWNAILLFDFVPTHGDTMHVVLILATTAPGLLFSAAFALLVINWAEIYYSAHRRVVPSVQRLRFLFYTMYTTVFLAVAVLCVIDVFTESMLVPVLFIDAGVHLVIASGFIVYGILIWRNFRGQPVVNSTATTKVGIITAVCFVSLLARSALILTELVMTLIGGNEQGLPFALDVVANIAFEIAPIVLMLWFFSFASRNRLRHPPSVAHTHPAAVEGSQYRDIASAQPRDETEQESLLPPGSIGFSSPA